MAMAPLASDCPIGPQAPECRRRGIQPCSHRHLELGPIDERAPQIEHGARRPHGAGSTLAAGAGPRQGRGRPVLVFGGHDRRVLPPVLPVSRGQSEKRPLPRQHRGRERGGVSALRALQPRWAFPRGRQCGTGGQGLPSHRRGESPAYARADGGLGRAEPGVLPSRVQGCDRSDAEGLRRGSAGGAHAGRAGPERDRDRGDLRRRLQLQRALLHRGAGRSRHDARPLPKGRCRGRPALRGRPVLARCDPGRLQRQGRGRHPDR